MKHCRLIWLIWLSSSSLYVQAQTVSTAAPTPAQTPTPASQTAVQTATLPSAAAPPALQTPTDTARVKVLGQEVNSEFNEINPLISPDGNTLYFARISHPTNTFGTKGSQDIWYSERDAATAQWKPAKRMPAPLNKDEYNCAYSITPDGNTMLIKGQYNNGVYETRGFSITKRTASGWSAPQKIDVPGYVNLSKGQFDCGFLSADGKVLLMAFSEKKNSKDDDLYVTFRQKDGSFSKPMNLGIEVNTAAFTETTPFLAPDGATLYFSSNRPGGLGSNDIYVTKRVDNTWKHWTKPKNLGPTVNSDGYDAYYSLSASGDFAYMTTLKNPATKGDIVRIRIGDSVPSPFPSDSTTLAKTPTDSSLRPDPVALISGRVIDQKTGKPLAARIVYQTLPDGAEAGEADTDPITGEYKLVLPYGKQYTMRAIAKDFIAVGDNVDLREKKAFQEIKNKELKLVPIEEGQSVRLNNIFFDVGKSQLRPESFPELDRLVTTFNENPKMTIEVQGHTDNTGSNDLNARLSQDRADSVREYLISKGIEPDRIGSKGFGEDKPVATNDTDAGRQLNRRVEFIIVKK